MTIDTKKIHVTPVGIAAWPRLNDPDTKFKPEGEFRVQLVLNPERNKDHAEFLSQIQETYEEAYKEACAEQKKLKLKRVPLSIKPETDKEGNETGTGNVLVKFSMKHNITSKKTGESFSMRPTLQDSAGKTVSPIKCRVGGGSTIRVAFNFNPFYSAGLGAGLNLRLVGVQIIKLVELSDGGYKFEGVEDDDGFVGEEMTAEEKAALRSSPKQAGGDKAKSDDGDY